MSEPAKVAAPPLALCPKCKRALLATRRPSVTWCRGCERVVSLSISVEAFMPICDDWTVGLW